MPATMIRKTALVNALREAFPDDLGNMYTEDDGGETFDRIKDVTPEPQESREDVLARKQAQIENWQNQKSKQEEPQPEPVKEVQTELLDENDELVY